LTPKPPPCIYFFVLVIFIDYIRFQELLSYLDTYTNTTKLKKWHLKMYLKGFDRDLRR